MGRTFLPTLAVSTENVERLKKIQEELGVKNFSELRRLAIGEFINRYYKDEKYKREVVGWFKKIIA